MLEDLPPISENGVTCVSKTSLLLCQRKRSPLEVSPATWAPFGEWERMDICAWMLESEGNLLLVFPVVTES